MHENISDGVNNLVLVVNWDPLRIDKDRTSLWNSLRIDEAWASLLKTFDGLHLLML